MTNAYLNFGEIGSFSASNAASYAANVIQLSTPKYFAGTPAKAVFTAKTALSSFKAALYSGETSSPTAVVAEAPAAVDMAIGDTVELAIPANLGTYLRAGGSSSTTTGKMDVCIELGSPRP